MDKWVMAEELGYTPQTTYWEDFSIAEPFGIAAIKDTALAAFNGCKDNYIWLTELIMVLNHKSWYWHQKNNELMELYAELYYKYDEKAIDYLEKNYGEEELRYFFRTLD